MSVDLVSLLRANSVEQPGAGKRSFIRSGRVGSSVRRTTLAWSLALVLAPVALADASPRFARLAWTDHGYHLSFELPQRADSPPVLMWTAGEEEGNVTAHHVPGPPNDDDAMYLAELPPRALTYRLADKDGRTGAPPGPDAPVRVAFLSDMGSSDDARAVWQAVGSADPDLIIIGGDLSYAHGRADMWDDWFRLVEPLASRVPVMVAFGNHESYCQGDGARVTPCLHETQEYLEHFHMPNAPKRYYDFDWGPAHFVALDTEAYEPRADVPTTNASDQLRFAEASLGGSDAAWNIAFFHRPLYSSTRGGEKESAEARAEIEPILDNAKADLVLTGHAHSYERSWPLRAGRVVGGSNETTQGDGWIHVVSGGGGRSLYPEFGTKPDWSAHREAAFHFVLMDISPTALQVRAITPDGGILDEFSIHKANDAQPSPSAPSRSGPP